MKTYIESLAKIVANLSDEDNWIKEMFCPIKKDCDLQKCNSIEELFVCYDFSKLDIGGVAFRKDIEESINHFFFAFEDTYYFGVNKNTREIDFIDSYTMKTIYTVAPSLEVFFAVLVKLASYSLKGFLGHEYTEEDRIGIYDECKAILVDKKFLGYYSERYNDSKAI